MTARVAIVGSGIAGLSAAHQLHGHADIHLFEAGDYFGGHTHTVDITLPGTKGPVSFGVDTMRTGEPGTVDLLLERADKALYRAKKSGRNRVESYAAA